MKKKSAMIAVIHWLVTIPVGGYAIAQAPPAGTACGPPPQAAFCSAVRGARAEGWPAQSRSEVMAQHGMVVTSQPLPAQAGFATRFGGGDTQRAPVWPGRPLPGVEAQTRWAAHVQGGP